MHLIRSASLVLLFMLPFFILFAQFLATICSRAFFCFKHFKWSWLGTPTWNNKILLTLGGLRCPWTPCRGVRSSPQIPGPQIPSRTYPRTYPALNLTQIPSRTYPRTYPALNLTIHSPKSEDLTQHFGLFLSGGGGGMSKEGENLCQ